jgi:hypothetical protein
MPALVPKPLSGRLGVLVQAGSLLVTGIFVWSAAVRPRLMFEPFSVVAFHALFYAALAWCFSAMVTAGLYLTLPDAERQQVVGSTLRAAGVGVWFAPACILLSQLSPATLAAALVLVIGATRLLYSEWVSAQPAPIPEATPRLGLFGGFTVKRPLVTRELYTGLAAAVAMQSGVISVWRHSPMLAGAFFVLSAAIVTLFAMISGAVEDSRPPSMPRSAIGMAMTVMLAAGLTIGGLRVASGRGNGDAEGPGAAGANRSAYASAKEVLKELFGDEDREKGKDGFAPKMPPIAPGIAPDGSFPGVFLWPEIKAVPRLVAPPPRGLSTGSAPARPYGIPFAGQYLLYRFPQQRPPATSILQRGSPAAMSFSTVDRRPLNMDAIQRLDEPIDLSCCRGIRIEIWNADRYPGTVTLELYANDRLLGRAPVRSTPDLTREPLVAVQETLEFPSAAVVCTELKVVFRRLASRMDKSARMAIERFVLEP